MATSARYSVVTLGVSDLARARAFYLDGLGYTAHRTSQKDITFIENAGTVLALYPREKLSHDAQVPDGSPGRFPGFTIGRLLRDRAAVDETLARAKVAGATITKPAADTFWGGYSGYFSDPDGFLWEIACAPQWRFDDAGRLLLDS
jgi:catechol 2,3-dioxygenase-like lactoylglutathione lyase family enzyme